jgi:uracil phosphoribosyltransferase
LLYIFVFTGEFFMIMQTYPEFPNFYEVRHPIILYKLALLRDPSTHRKLFKELTEEITVLLGYEATSQLPIQKRLINTPLETFEGLDLKSNAFVIVPILRAGLAMEDGLTKILPMASVGHIGLFRDETTLEAKNYYFKMPPNQQHATYFICDPMLATGGSACAAVAKLKSVGITQIIFICLVAAPEGVRRMLQTHPEIKIYAASLDRELNPNGYILPGLGDAGDRLWAVK